MTHLQHPWGFLSLLCTLNPLPSRGRLHIAGFPRHSNNTYHKPSPYTLASWSARMNITWYEVNHALWVVEIMPESVCFVLHVTEPRPTFVDARRKTEFGGMVWWPCIFDDCPGELNNSKRNEEGLFVFLFYLSSCVLCVGGDGEGRQRKMLHRYIQGIEHLKHLFF